jgi:copper resistance protein C
MHRAPRHHRVPRSASRRAAFLLLVLGFLVFAGPSSAEAHAVLVRTSPAHSSSVRVPPAEVVLTFDEAPLTVGAIVRVSGPSGIVSTGSPQVDGTTVHESLQKGLPAGSYRVDWKVTSDDGHPVSNTFTFAVTGASPAGSPSTSPGSASGIQPAQAAGAISAPSSGVGPGVAWALGLVVLLLLAVALVLSLAHRRNLQEKP